MVILRRLTYYQVCRRLRADIWGNIVYRKRLAVLRSRLRFSFVKSINFKQLYRSMFRRAKRFRKRGFLLLLERRKIVSNKSKKLKFYTKLVREKHRFKYYYMIRTDRDCQRLFDYCRKQFTRYDFNSLLLFQLESRLNSFLFRANLTLSPYLSSVLIRKGFVTVNQKLILSPTYSFKIGDVVALLPYSVDRNEFIFRAKMGLFKFRPMPWVFSSYYSFTFLIWRMPKFNEFDFPYPMKFDLVLKNFRR